MKTNYVYVCVLIFVNQIKILFNREVPCCIYKSRVLIHMKANCKSVCVYQFCEANLFDREVPYCIHKL